jgi:hypothetical protein
VFTRAGGERKTQDTRRKTQDCLVSYKQASNRKDSVTVHFVIALISDG